MSTKLRWLRICLLVGVFAATFVPRAYRPPPRATYWIERARAFDASLNERDWMSMFQSRHPGATTMAVGGLTLRLYRAVERTPAGALFNWFVPPGATDYVQTLSLMIVGMAAALAALTTATTLVLRKLAGWPLALTVAGLMAFEPFYLSASRILHVDALVSTLMLLSALLLLVFLETGQRRYLLLSGLTGGLAWLTKTPSLFLAPFTGLALLTRLVGEPGTASPDQPEETTRKLLARTWDSVVKPGLLWLAVAMVPLALWPPMWVKPLFVLGTIFAGTWQHVLQPHPMPRFFAGQLHTGERPTIFFYPVSLAFNSTFVTLTLSLMAIGFYTVLRRRVRPPMRPTIFWLLVAYAGFFTLQMTIAAKQTPRYVLPVCLALDVLAGVGGVGLVDLMRRAATVRPGRLAGAPISALAGLVISLQALVALAYAPHYGTHHNHLLGGNRVAVKVIEIMLQDEGLVYVAEYLNRQPNAESLRVGTPSWRLFIALKLESFPGKVLEGMAPDADYYLFDRDDLQRGIQPDMWEAAWETYRSRPAEVVVTFDGVEYLWLYAVEPAEPGEQIVIRRGGIAFVGLAWAWAVGLSALVAWSIRRSGR